MFARSIASNKRAQGGWSVVEMPCLVQQLELSYHFELIVPDHVMIHLISLGAIFVNQYERESPRLVLSSSI